MRRSSACGSAMRREQDAQPDGWLMALPQSTLINLMHRRCRMISSIVRVGQKEGTFNFDLLTDEEIIEQERRIDE